MAVLAQQHRKSVGAVVDQALRLADLVTGLRPAEFLRPLPCRPDRVLDITARIVLIQTSLLASLDHGTNQRPIALPDYFGGRSATQHRLDRLSREVARHESGAGLAAQFAEATHEVKRRLDAADAPAVVAVQETAIRTVDLLRVIGIDWVLHTDDINRALPGHRPIIISRETLADAVRTLADTLRGRHPGHSIEVRIPPFAAVQCGTAGEPKHTRGTPPTVIETDPLPWVRLCRGRETWAEAVKHGHLRASGIRGDISDWLPLY